VRGIRQAAGIALLCVAGTGMLYAIDAAAGHMVEALPPRDIGKEVYYKYCIRCHAADRRGVRQAPLGAVLLQRYEIKTLIKKLRQGCWDNADSPYDFLKMYELVKVSRYITAKAPK